MQATNFEPVTDSRYVALLHIALAEIKRVLGDKPDQRPNELPPG